ncbi:MAG: hypothetical protein HF981_04375 [Desulfobacteraceae bacterium]|nr:hypothetical protein [Desulfobacteraceae bacterium]MBC2749601.1 hypothetical protein [Desulfobacteraceae bacterium]
MKNCEATLSFFTGFFLILMLSLSILCNVALAEEVLTAKLKATPEIAKPGSSIQFQATIFFNPDFYAQPGEMVQVLVAKEDMSWISDKINIQYPASGLKIVNFTESFPIPASGGIKEHNFVLVNKIWWRMSRTTSVKVMTMQKKKQFKQIEPKQPVPIKIQ